MSILLRSIDIIFQVFTLMLFARILGSWIPGLNGTRFMRFIAFYVDPYLNFFRRFIPPIGMIDISPIFAIFALGFIQFGLKWILVTIWNLFA